MVKNVKTEKSKQVEDLENQLKRIAADYQNLEKRVEKERLAWIKSSNKNLLLRLLPSLDTLNLAQKHVEDEGLKLSIQKFIDALKEEGVQRIETQGKTFDPKTMEAVDVQEGEEGKVLEEIRAGYMLKDQILRPAQVKVGKQKVDIKEEEKVKEESQRGADEQSDGARLRSDSGDKGGYSI